MKFILVTTLTMAFVSSFLGAVDFDDDALYLQSRYTSNKNKHIQVVFENNAQLQNDSAEDTSQWQFLMQKAYNLSQEERYDEAILKIKEAIDISKNETPVDYEEIIASLNDLVQLYSKVSDPDKALVIAEQSIKISKNRFGRDDVVYASALAAMGYLLGSNKQYEQSISYYQSALDIYKHNVLVDETPLIDTFLALSLIYAKQGDYEKSIATIEDATLIIEEKSGNNDILLIQAYIQKAKIYTKMNRLAKAKEYYRRSLEMLKADNGDNPQVAYALFKSLTNFYIDIKEYFKAKEIAKQYISLSTKLFGAKDNRTLEAEGSLTFIDNLLLQQQEISLAISDVDREDAREPIKNNFIAATHKDGKSDEPHSSQTESGTKSEIFIADSNETQETSLAPQEGVEHKLKELEDNLQKLTQKRHL